MPPVPTKDVVTLASATEDLSTLVTAVKAAGLVSTLAGKGPFTVFAPSNEAFAALPKGALSYLLEPTNVDKLKQLLEYHVVSGVAKTSSLTNGEAIKTLEGSTVTASVTA